MLISCGTSCIYIHGISLNLCSLARYKNSWALRFSFRRLPHSQSTYAYFNPPPGAQAFMHEYSRVHLMTKNGFLRLLPFLLLICMDAKAADEIILGPEQLKSIGISTEKLSATQSGELSGMPAQVTVPSNQLYVVTSPLPALVEQTIVGIGDTVKKGQLLARLQSPALAEAQRGLLQATTRAQLARENQGRDAKLWKDGIISESRYRTTKSRYMEANATLTERKQVLRLSGMSKNAIIKLQEGKDLGSLLAVRSPINGVILEKTANAGERIDAVTPIFKVAKLYPLALNIQAPLESIRGLRVGATVSIPAYGAKGKLIAIGHGLSGANQTVLLRALIDKGTKNLRTGQFVEASIATASKSPSQQWDVPNSAIARINGKTFIFVQTQGGFRPQAVKILHEGVHSSIVSAPLIISDRIAVHGVSALKARMMGIGGGG